MTINYFEAGKVESLSDKIHRNSYEDTPDLDSVIDVKDVKEAIKKLKDAFNFRNYTEFSKAECIFIINEIFGEALI